MMVLLLAGAAAEDATIRQARERMVSHDIRRRGISDQTVLEVMGAVPRHLFVDPSLRWTAYADHPLPIGEGQTISQPYIVALMTQALELEKSGARAEKVLEIGTGSGYQAAVLSRIVPKVYTIEIKKGLADKAAATLEDLGFRNVSTRSGDGYFGWPEEAPFDAIMITCAVDHIPQPLKEQLADGGRLILPLGSPWLYQTLTLVTREGDDYRVRYITEVSFVPMTGAARK